MYGANTTCSLVQPKMYEQNNTGSLVIVRFTQGIRRGRVKVEKGTGRDVDIILHEEKIKKVGI